MAVGEDATQFDAARQVADQVWCDFEDWFRDLVEDGQADSVRRWVRATFIVEELSRRGERVGLATWIGTCRDLAPLLRA